MQKWIFGIVVNDNSPDHTAFLDGLVQNHLILRNISTK